jgi:hypothetical protein
VERCVDVGGFRLRRRQEIASGARMLLQTQEAQVASEVSSSQYSTRVPVLVPVLVPVPPVLVLVLYK